MSKLFLTSAGFTTDNLKNYFFGNCNIDISSAKVAMIALTNSPDELVYVDLSKNELERMGFSSIKILNLKDQLYSELLEDLDVIQICGGNTFAILKRLRETGLDKKIIDLVKRGVVYIGISAGSIIAGPDIEIAGWGSEGDKNYVNLKELHGFSLTDIAVFPHFHDELLDEVNEFKKKVKYPVETLNNEQMLFITNQETLFVD